MAVFSLLIGGLFLPAARGYGMMLEPISRNAPVGINTLGGSMWFSQGCSIGCSQCNDTGVPVDPGFPGPGYVPPSPNVGSYLGDECPNDHAKSKKPTINDPTLLTMNYDVRFQPSLASHPWRAPGSTPGLDPCGLAGGAHTNMSYRAGGFGPQTGYPQGFRGSKLPPIPKHLRSVWKAGSIANVTWVSVANHAGGYSYALCPADQELTEACFEETPLQFVDDKTTLRYMFLTGNGTLGSNRTEVVIPAQRVTEGVLPKGSMWSKNPIPPGSWVSGKGLAVERPRQGTAPQGNNQPAQFEPPAGCDENCWGYQPCNVGYTHPSYEGWNHTLDKLPNCSRASPGAPVKNGEGCCHTTAYNALVDKVHVPQVPPGEYVVRWRWDCEQSPQIWSGCGDILIV